MNILTIILIIAIIIVVAITGIMLYIDYKNRKDQPETKTPIRNLLYKFNNLHERGKLVKSIPVGKNKNLRRIVYATIHKDDYGEEKLVYDTVIVHKDFIMRNEREDVLLPKSPTQLDATEPQYEKFKQFIGTNRSFNTIADASNNALNKLETVFKQTYAMQINSDIYHNTKSKMLETINEFGNKDKKPENKEDKSKSESA
jgi:hypothetical protein